MRLIRRGVLRRIIIAAMSTKVFALSALLDYSPRSLVGVSWSVASGVYISLGFLRSPRIRPSGRAAQAELIYNLPDVRQCLLYDSSDANARLIGVEYMVSPKVFETLPEDEKKLWHSHVYEVKSGILIMPAPNTVPDLLWEKAETKEMEAVIGWYGKM